MDLLKAYNEYVIIIFVDHVCKCAHSCTLSHPFTPSVVTHVFVEPTFKLHAVPPPVALNRDPTLASHFKRDSFKL